MSRGAEPDELRSVADDLAELAELRWGDVGLRETPEAQQVDEVLGITLVVLHSAVAPVVAEWVGEVEVRAELFEEVREPVPPVARLEDDLWVLTGFRELSANASRSLSRWTVSRTVPAASLWTITERRRWKSMPT